MKLRLINSYKKRRTVKDPITGNPVMNVLTGKEEKEAKPTTYFRYGVMEATKEELLLYKKFKLQDGPYYKEELIEGKKRPLWHGEYLGKEVILKGYKREDGRIGFSADTTDIDELIQLGEKFPAMKAQLDAQIAGMQLSGRRWNLDEKAADLEEEESAADEFASVADETSSDTEGADDTDSETETDE